MLIYTKEYSLSASSCDEISAEIAAFCVNQHVDGKRVGWFYNERMILWY